MFCAHEAENLRRRAADARALAASISLRPDREVLLDMARQYDANADQLERRSQSANWVPTAPLLSADEDGKVAVNGHGGQL